MATHTAAEGTVTVKPTDSGTATSIGSITSFSLDENVELIDKTLLSSTYKAQAAGSKSFSGSIECFWDEADAPQLLTIAGAELSFQILPEGATSGDYGYSGNAFIESTSISAAVDGMITMPVNISGNGALTPGPI